MKLSFFYTVDTWLLCVLLFLAMMAGVEGGRRFARNRSKGYADNPSNSAIAASLYGLLGLLLAFTFGMSGERFKERKRMMVDEANAIGTAALRHQLYADSVQPEFQKLFEQYIEARIMYYTAPDTALILRAFAEANRQGQALWMLAARHARTNGNLVASNQMVPALNDMLDRCSAQFWMEYNRTPISILIMLFFLAVATAFVAGHTSVGKGNFDWWMAIGFCLLTALVVFFIIDLDKPRRGIITLQENVHAITALRNIFKP